MQDLTALDEAALLARWPAWDGLESSVRGLATDPCVAAGAVQESKPKHLTASQAPSPACDRGRLARVAERVVGAASTGRGAQADAGCSWLPGNSRTARPHARTGETGLQPGAPHPQPTTPFSTWQPRLAGLTRLSTISSRARVSGVGRTSRPQTLPGRISRAALLKSG